MSGLLAIFVVVAQLPVETATTSTDLAQTSTLTRTSTVPPAWPTASMTIADLIGRARQLYEELEYDRVIPFAEAVLERPGGTIEQRLDAYLLQGSCLAIVGNPIDAETSFRLLLRGRPDFEMPENTSPKILTVFTKVQTEERAISNELEALQRQRIVEELQIEGHPPNLVPGGRPLQFEYALTDPRRVVSRMTVHYRRSGQKDFSALALERTRFGIWKGALPGEWTAGPAGFAFEFYLSTADEHGVDLLTVADASAPRALWVTPGEVPSVVPFYETLWFWAAAAALVVASGVASAIAVDQATRLPESDLGELFVE